MDDQTSINEGATTPQPERQSRPAALDDPRALQILNSEFGSLLSARSLVYTESYQRASMFLTFLSATLVALGLVVAGTGFSRDFLIVAALIFGLDLLIGITTSSRVMSATTEDIRFLLGLNRMRHAFHDAVPGLERYFISSSHDDLPALFGFYGSPEPANITSLGNVWHGFTTTVGMLTVICAGLATVLTADLLLLLVDSPVIAALGAVAVFALALVVGIAWHLRRIRLEVESLRPEFPSTAP